MLIPEAIPKGLNVNNHPENSGWDENTGSSRTMKWFNYNALVNIEPFQGSLQRCYFIPQVSPVVIHIQPLRGFRQFFSRPYFEVQIFHGTIFIHIHFEVFEAFEAFAMFANLVVLFDFGFNGLVCCEK